MSITQKVCPETIIIEDTDEGFEGEEIRTTCGKPAVKIDRDRYGKRTCADGHEWFPSKIRKDDNGSL